MKKILVTICLFIIMPFSLLYGADSKIKVTKKVIANKDTIILKPRTEAESKKILSHMELGDEYLNNHLYEMAEEEYQKALALWPDNITVIAQLCYVYFICSDYAKLETFAEKGMQIIVTQKPKYDDFSVARCYSSYADVLSLKGNYAAAVDLDIKSYNIVKNLENSNSLCFSRCNSIALAYCVLKDKRAAEHWFNEALNYTSDPEERKEVYNNISKNCYPKY